MVQHEVDLGAPVAPVEEAQVSQDGERVEGGSDEILHEHPQLDRIIERCKAALEGSVADGAIEEIQLAAALLDCGLTA